MSALRAPAAPSTEATIERYSFGERVLHWWVALTFIALMVSGFALGYPRAAFLAGLFGGGQTMRFLHPWIGVGFTLGIAGMTFAWAKDMRAEPVDKEFRKHLRTYATTGHTGLDVGRYNAGQKSYFWASLLFAAVLVVTGIFLWYPWIAGAGINQVSRLLHHVVFLLAVGGLILHVYLSTVMFPGTMSAMLTGRVTRSWAAFHHPGWFRERSR